GLPWLTACQPAQTLTVPARAGFAATPISEAAPLGLEPVGALAGFDSAGMSAEPVGALAGFDSAAIALTGPPAPAAMAAGCAQRMCRATAERSIPNSRAILRCDQPCASERGSVALNVILGWFGFLF